MKDPRYEAGVKQSEVPKALCQRAAWYLNNVGLDATKYKRRTIKEFNAILSDQIAGPITPDQQQYLDIVWGNVDRLAAVIRWHW